MKRLVAFSDSHGAQETLERCVRHALTGVKPYAALFLGDGEKDFEALHPLLYRCGVHAYQVTGNNDWYSSYEKDFVFCVDGVSIYACHGHQWRVRYSTASLEYAALERGAKAAFFGHTHVPYMEYVNGLWLINPGSARDCTGNSVRYAELMIDDDGTLRPNIVDAEFNGLSCMQEKK